MHPENASLAGLAQLYLTEEKQTASLIPSNNKTLLFLIDRLSKQLHGQPKGSRKGKVKAGGTLEHLIHPSKLHSHL